MRTAEELERVAFREKLTAEEDDLLFDHFRQRAETADDRKQRTSALKQAAFFASRAFEKGLRTPDRLAAYVDILKSAQALDPSDNFRRKLAEMKSAASGKAGHQASLKKLARAGEAFDRGVLANDGELDEIESDLGAKLPPSYREYLKKYAHRQIGTFEPYVAGELVAKVREAWDSGLESFLLPFLEDNADHYCFDMRSSLPEPPVVFRPHDGTSDETWPNFAAWIEECWVAELE